MQWPGDGKQASFDLIPVNNCLQVLFRSRHAILDYSKYLVLRAKLRDN